MYCNVTQSMQIDTLDCFLTFKRSILSSNFEIRVKTERVVSNLSKELRKSKNLPSFTEMELQPKEEKKMWTEFEFFRRI